MKSGSICASTIDQCVHTNALPCLDPNVLRLAMPRPKNVVPCYVTPAFSGIPKQRGTKSQVKTSARGHHDAPRGP